MQTTNLLLDAPGAGAATEAQSSQTAQTSAGQGGEFLSLVQALIQGQPQDTNVEGVRAGQQADVMEVKKQGDQPTAEAQITACLLGSSGSVQQTPVLPVITEQISDSAQIAADAAPASASPSAPVNVQQPELVPAETLPVSAQHTEALPATAAQGNAQTEMASVQKAQEGTQPAIPVTDADTKPVVASGEAPIQDSGVKQPNPNGAKPVEAADNSEDDRSPKPHIVEHDSTQRPADTPRSTQPAIHQQDQVNKGQETPPGLDAREMVLSTHARSTETLPPLQAAAGEVSPGSNTQADEATGSQKPSVNERAWTTLTVSSDAQRSQMEAPATLSQIEVQANRPSVKQVDWSEAIVDSVSPKEDIADVRVKAVQSGDRASAESSRDSGLLAAGQGSPIVDKTPPESVSPDLQPARETGAKIINQIVRAAKTTFFEGGAGMTLRLDPPHLGTVHMNVTSTDGAVTAVLQTSSEAAKQIISADMASLREALASSGINVDSINVSVGGGPDQGWNPQGSHGEAGSGFGRPNAPWGLGTTGGQEAVPIGMAAEVRASYGRVFDYLA